MARKTTHQCAMRELAADQGSFASDSTYRYGVTWCGDRQLFSESDRARDAADTNCPKCAAALGKANLAKLNAGGARIELERIADLKGCAAYSLRYARSAYRFKVAGELRGFIIAEAGFGKGWSLRMVAGALAFASSSDGRECGDSLTGDKPDRWRKLGEGASFRMVHYCALEAMAVAAWRAYQRGELPTPAEQEERAAARKAKAQAEAAEREAARAQREREREAERLATLEAKATARHALEELRKRADLSNLELAGLAALERLAAL